jgi:hypothetical protein
VHRGGDEGFKIMCKNTYLKLHHQYNKNKIYNHGGHGEHGGEFQAFKKNSLYFPPLKK